MLVYSDHLTAAAIGDALSVTGLSGDGVLLELHGPMGSRKRARRFVVKLSASPGTDRFGTRRRWANSGRWGASTPRNNYVEEPLGAKAATFDEWGVFIAELFRRDPDAIVGQYATPAELERAWQMPTPTAA